MHPSLVKHYAGPFDAMTDERWNAITGIFPSNPRYLTLLMRRTLPTDQGGSGIPAAVALAPSALLSSLKTITPLLQLFSPIVYAHFMETLQSTDPLGANIAFAAVKEVHDWILRQPIDGTHGAYHLPPTAIPGSVKTMLTAKQRYSSHTLAKNLHKHTKLRILQQYKRYPQLYREDIVQLLSQSSQGAAAWLTLPPSVMCILEAPSEQVNPVVGHSLPNMGWGYSPLPN